MSSPRRTFLKHAGFGAAALAAFPGSGQAAPRSRASEVRREMDALIEAEGSAEAMPQDVWDTSWAKRIVGTHKAMFDVPEIDGGAGVLRSGIWQRQYNEVLKPKSGDMTSVVVIRHNAIHLAMKQEYWTAYNVGEEYKINGDDDKPLKYNPVLPAPDSDTPPSMASLMLDKQIADGAIVLACNLAFRSVAGLVQRKDKLSPAEARTKALSMMVPGVIMQPSGIFANVLAQQSGCVFVQAV